MKKLAGLAAAGAMLLGMAAPVLAGTYVYNFGFAYQETGAGAVASSGGNSYAAGGNGGSITQSGDIETGDAVAVALAQSMANQFSTEVWTDCDCDVEVLNGGELETGAVQLTAALAGAGTGSNTYGAGDNAGNITQSGNTTTGNATAVATAQSWANIFTTFVTSVGVD
mgnify:CR=1 FL=1